MSKSRYINVKLLTYLLIFAIAGINPISYWIVSPILRTINVNVISHNDSVSSSAGTISVFHCSIDLDSIFKEKS